MIHNQIVIEDLLRFATFTMIVHIATCLSGNTELFDDTFLITISYTIIGIICFHYFIKPNLPKIDNKHNK